MGQYPVLNFQYRIITRVPSLVGRLAVQNRSFEAAGMDAIQDGILAASNIFTHLPAAVIAARTEATADQQRKRQPAAAAASAPSSP